MKKIIFKYSGWLLIFSAIILLSNCATVIEKKCISEKEEIVKKTTLANGLSIITREIPNNIVSLQIWFKVGSRNEDEKNNGLSHFIEHLIFKGTKKRGVSQLSQEIESVGGKLNGATSKDYTFYYATIAKDFIDLAIDGLIDSVLNPAFDKDEIEKERKVVVEEILRQEDEPFSTLFNLSNSISYINHAYKMPVIGKKEIIENLSREDIVAYYNKFYVPENMIIVITGDFNTEEIVKKIKKYFPKDNTETHLPSANIKPEFNSLKVEKETNFKKCYLAVSWLAPNVDNEDTYTMDVLTVIIGQGRSSRLYSHLKEKLQICYSIGSSYSTMKDEGLFNIRATLEEKNEIILEDKIMEEINKTKEGVSLNELNKAKAIIENNYIFEHETNESIGNSLGYYEAISSYKLELFYLDNIKKVNLDDVKKVANKYLSGKPSIVVLKHEKTDKRNNK
ncbi:MAG: pitrilysin family protein [Candidatus Firestonebacteria bacterium]